MRKRPPAWVVVAVVSAATALGSFLPGSGLLGEHAEALPRAIGPVAASTATTAVPRPRPAAEAAAAASTAGAAAAGAPARGVPAARSRKAARPGHPARARQHHDRRSRHDRHGRHDHAQHRAVNPVPVHARGADVSWPQCGRGLPMPQGKSFVVVGLTNGPAFEENPCVATQVRWARAHHLHTGAYAVTSYPSRRELARHGRTGPWPAHTLAGRLRNVGWSEAQRAVATLRRVGLRPPLVWVDVEPSVRRPWSAHRWRNAAVVRGLVAGYRHQGHRIGFYSTAKLWRHIVGPVRFRAPEWRTAGPSTPHAALARCRQPRASIQGGRPVLAQWWTTRRDHDALCPGSREPERLRLFFTTY